MAEFSLILLLRNGSIYLAFLLLLKKFCNGEFQPFKILLGDGSQRSIHGIVITAEMVLIGMIALYYWITCLSSKRTYYLKLPGNSGQPTHRPAGLWVPAPNALAAAPWRPISQTSADPQTDTADAPFLFFLLLTWTSGCLTYLLINLSQHREAAMRQEREASYAKAVYEREEWTRSTRKTEYHRFHNDHTLPFLPDR